LFTIETDIECVEKTKKKKDKLKQRARVKNKIK
jgi:hypothetical protein